MIRIEIKSERKVGINFNSFHFSTKLDPPTNERSHRRYCMRCIHTRRVKTFRVFFFFPIKLAFRQCVNRNPRAGSILARVISKSREIREKEKRVQRRIGAKIDPPRCRYNLHQMNKEPNLLPLCAHPNLKTTPSINASS